MDGKLYTKDEIEKIKNLNKTILKDINLLDYNGFQLDENDLNTLLSEWKKLYSTIYKDIYFYILDIVKEISKKYKKKFHLLNKYNIVDVLCASNYNLYLNICNKISSSAISRIYNIPIEFKKIFKKIEIYTKISSVSNVDTLKHSKSINNLMYDENNKIILKSFPLIESIFNNNLDIDNYHYHNKTIKKSKIDFYININDLMNDVIATMLNNNSNLLNNPENKELTTSYILKSLIIISNSGEYGKFSDSNDFADKNSVGLLKLLVIQLYKIDFYKINKDKVKNSLRNSFMENGYSIRKFKEIVLPIINKNEEINNIILNRAKILCNFEDLIELIYKNSKYMSYYNTHMVGEDYDKYMDIKYLNIDDDKKSKIINILKEYDHQLIKYVNYSSVWEIFKNTVVKFNLKFIINAYVLILHSVVALKFIMNTKEYFDALNKINPIFLTAPKAIVNKFLDIKNFIFNSCEKEDTKDYREYSDISEISFDNFIINSSALDQYYLDRIKKINDDIGINNINILFNNELKYNFCVFGFKSIDIANYELLDNIFNDKYVRSDNFIQMILHNDIAIKINKDYNKEFKHIKSNKYELKGNPDNGNAQLINDDKSINLDFYLTIDGNYKSFESLDTFNKDLVRGVDLVIKHKNDVTEECYLNALKVKDYLLRKGNN